MTVDSFKFLPRAIARFYQLTEVAPVRDIPWSVPSKPLDACKLALLTSGGLYRANEQPPFNLEQERRKPEWGDPSCRVLDLTRPMGDVAVSHLHYNPAAVLEDVNVLLPHERARALVRDGVLGALARSAYSLMGYQGFPPDVTAWAEHSVPEIVARCRQEDVDVILLVPTWPDCAINVPGLARLLEAEGLITVMVTPMPYWAERIGCPRALAVEFPFGQTMGPAHDASLQRRVLEEALALVESAGSPGVIVHSEARWPRPVAESMAAWQPAAPSPIVAVMLPRLRALLKAQRDRRRRELER